MSLRTWASTSSPQASSRAGSDAAACSGYAARASTIAARTSGWGSRRKGSSRGSPAELAPAIRQSGYHTYVLDPAEETGGDPVLGELMRALGVAGFAAGNIMLFSVSIWSGANDATRDLFHWISAIIALPAIAYAGRIFFRSAWRALRVGKTNMDVPISIGVILATALSLFETLQ